MCPTSVHSDLQVRRINVTLFVLSANTLLTVGDGKYWFRLLNKDLCILEWVENCTPTLTHSTKRKLKVSLLHIHTQRNLGSFYILIFISDELKSNEHIYNVPI